MDKQKIIQTVERQTSIESARKEIVTLKTLLNTTECKISQYQIELNNLEKNIEEEEKALELERKKAIAQAEEYANNLIKLNENKIDAYNKQIIQQEQTYKTQIDILKEEEATLKEKLELFKTQTQEEIETLGSELDKIKNKTYLFKAKQKEEDIKRLEKMIETYNINLANKQILTTNDINNIENNMKNIKEEFESNKADINKVIDLAKQNNETHKSNLAHQKELFTSINTCSDEDYAKRSKLTYFDKETLNNVMNLIEKITTTKNKKQEKEIVLNQSKIEKEDIINKINSLNAKIEEALKEREDLKEMLEQTKENFGKQVKNTINTVKSAADTAFSYENAEEKPKTSEDINDDDPFGFKSIFEESKKETQSFLSDLAGKIIEDYATQQSNEEDNAPTLGDAIHKAVKFFGKRK